MLFAYNEKKSTSYPPSPSNSFDSTRNLEIIKFVIDVVDRVETKDLINIITRLNDFLGSGWREATSFPELLFFFVLVILLMKTMNKQRQETFKTEKKLF